MAKFNAEEKLEAVKRYLNGSESAREIGENIGVTHRNLLTWVKQYEHHGDEAFMKRCTNYTQQFKLDVLSFMAENGTSLNETAAIFKIAAPSTVHVWKRQLEAQGIDALQPKQKGRPSMKKEPNQPSKPEATEGSIEALETRIKQLEMENAYLKKLNALAQNKGKSPNKTKHK